MHTAHKIEIKPTPAQEVYLRKACGVARFAYNWGLAEWGKQYNEGKTPSVFSIKKALNAAKKEQFPWMYEVTKCAPEGALFNLAAGFNAFFKKQANYPTFKVKKRCRDSFYISNEQLRLNGKRLRLPRLATPIKLTESLRFTGKILNATISRSANKWFLAVSIEIPDAVPSENQAQVGIDLGISSAIVSSNNEVFKSPRPLKNSLKRVKRLQKQLSRKKEGSQNYKKLARKLALEHYRITCRRSDFTHKTTTEVVKKYGVICMEDLAVKNIVKNHKLAQALMDIGFGEIRRQIEYKAQRVKQQVIAIDRFFPSTKRCHKCFHVVDKMSLSQRIFSCPECSLTEDRDLNAARNILIEGRKYTDGSSGI